MVLSYVFFCRWQNVRSSCPCWSSSWIQRSPTGKGVWLWRCFISLVYNLTYWGEREREREITLLSLLYYYYYHVIIDSLIFVFFRSFTQSYDMKLHSTKIFRDIVNGVGTYIQSQFMNPSLSTTTTSEEFQWYCIFQNKCTVPSCRSSYLMTIVQHYCSHITYTT